MPAPTDPALSAASQRNHARRDQILSAATNLFGEKGFHGSSMAELAKRAGMSVGHIYHYFESKDAIVEALVDREMQHMPGVLDASVCADDMVAAMMDGLEETAEHHLDRDRTALWLEMLAEAARNPRIARKLHSADVASRDRMTQAVSERLAGLGQREVADRVEAIGATFEGLIARAVHNPDLDRDTVVRTTRLVLRELLTNNTTVVPPSASGKAAGKAARSRKGV
jgi:TetR/AcrR family transcriptional repressor of uid operon